MKGCRNVVQLLYRLRRYPNDFQQVSIRDECIRCDVAVIPGSAPPGRWARGLLMAGEWMAGSGRWQWTLAVDDVGSGRW